MPHLAAGPPKSVESSSRRAGHPTPAQKPPTVAPRTAQRSYKTCTLLFLHTRRRKPGSCADGGSYDGCSRGILEGRSPGPAVRVVAIARRAEATIMPRPSSALAPLRRFLQHRKAHPCRTMHSTVGRRDRCVSRWRRHHNRHDAIDRPGRLGDGRIRGGLPQPDGQHGVLRGVVYPAVLIARKVPAEYVLAHGLAAGARASSLGWGATRWGRRPRRHGRVRAARCRG